MSPRRTQNPQAEGVPPLDIFGAADAKVPATVRFTGQLLERFGLPTVLLLVILATAGALYYFAREDLREERAANRVLIEKTTGEFTAAFKQITAATTTNTEAVRDLAAELRINNERMSAVERWMIVTSPHAIAVPAPSTLRPQPTATTTTAAAVAGDP